MRVLIFSVLGLFALAGIAEIAFFLPRFKRECGMRARKLRSFRTEIFLSRAGQVEYLVSGTGIPLLVSHGINGGFDQALGIAEMYAGEGYKVIAVSRFGYLGSALPPDSSPRAQAEVFAELLDHLNLERVFLLGNSAGGTPAIRFALDFPRLCRGLVLLSSNVPAKISLPPRPLMSWIFGSDYLYWRLVTSFPARMLSLFIPAGMMASLSPQRRQELIGDILLSGLPVKERTKGFLNDMYLCNPAINRDYPFSAVPVPVLVIHAQDDPAPPFEGARRMAEKMPHAVLVSVETGGHLLLGHEERVKGEIAAFLAHCCV